MLKSEDNERLVRVGPGKPLGELMRRYWQPALLCGELPENDCPPVRVRLLCEDLVAFRDTSGRIGLVEAYCPHRRAPCSSAATRNVVCVASITAGNSIPRAIASTSPRNLPARR